MTMLSLIEAAQLMPGAVVRGDGNVTFERVGIAARQAPAICSSRSRAIGSMHTIFCATSPRAAQAPCWLRICPTIGRYRRSSCQTRARRSVRLRAAGGAALRCRSSR